MDKEQRTAFLLAQVACMYAELEAMKAHDRNSDTEPYTEDAYSDLPVRFGLIHNLAIAFLLGE